MTEASWTKGPPKKLLLATDLSARCDRATDRAALLSRQWQAPLHVLHVLNPAERFIEQRQLDDLPSWRRPRDRKALAEARLRRDLAGHLDHFTLTVAEGDPAAMIDEVARTEGCDLIITGIARDETLGRYFLGATVDRLIRRATVPVLVVKARARSYQEIVIATDFSESSRHALNAAAAFFPDTTLTLFHAFDVPMAAFLDDAGLQDQFRTMGQQACDRFLAQSALGEDRKRAVKTLVEYGRPETMIRAYMEDRGAGLVCLGSHGRSGILDVLIGSTARKIVEFSPGDVLLVREPRAALIGRNADGDA